MHQTLALALVVALALPACNAQQPGNAAADVARPQPATMQHGVRITTIASGLEHPWSVALLPDGDLLLLERSFNGLFPGMSLRRFPIAELKPGAVIKPVPIFETTLPRDNIDNMEGLAVHVTASGETRITIISDDNYNRAIQNTILLQFALKE